MKKYICIMLMAIMVCLAAAGLAATEQEAAKDFVKTWVSEDGEGVLLDISYDEEEGIFDLSAVYGISEDEEYSIDFVQCKYDAGDGTLKCSGGVLLHEKTGRTEDEDIEEEKASGFSATLSIDENQRLHWTGSGDAVPDRVFSNLDDDRFVGEWVCEAMTMYINPNGNGYDVFITPDTEELEDVSWEYKCSADSENGTLTGTGSKSADYYLNRDMDINTAFQNVGGDAELLVFDSVPLYIDGKVTFTLDGDALIWNDEKEDAGNGLRFVHVVDAEG